MASTEGGDQPPESKQDSVRIGSTCFSINLNYVKSLLGIFEAAIIHFFIGAIFTFLYLIASIVMVTHTCGRGGYTAAAVFGFITTIVSGVETYFLLLSLRQDHAPTDNKVLNMLGVPKATPQSPEYDAGSIPGSKY
uniref:MARVEL domain-containing protein n=1 Tax=Magallana gigas TaxID=29159 RepID=K1R5E5_MAGGI